jgi:hypothetical protein
MELTEAFEKKEKEIVASWIDKTLDSYVSSSFFKQSADRFANPVGANIKDGLTRIYGFITSDADMEEIKSPLDQLIRIRAVQEFTPGQAIAPVMEIKWIVRQVFSADKKTRVLLGQLDSFDCSVDRLTLLAFDIYSECREQLYRNRVRELKSGRHILTDSACASAVIKNNQQEIASFTESGKTCS